MAYFIRNGDTFRVSDENAMDLHHVLPPGNYLVMFDERNDCFFLQQADRFTKQSKYYGDVLQNVGRVHTTFDDRPHTTGVVLTGEKGSGKSLLAKEISIRGYDLGIPTLVINQEWCGDVFNKFIQSINQPTIVLFDEFEKVYTKPKQEAILTLLDGVFPSKKLFIITCNDKWRIDAHMRNRPGRIYYMFEFEGLGSDFIKDYCEDNLMVDYTSYTGDIANISTLFSQFNFDMLKAMVEEINRYGESPRDVMKILNAKPEYDNTEDGHFTVSIRVDGKPYPYKIHTRSWRSNPLTATEIQIEVAGLDDDDYDIMRFIPADMTRLDGRSGEYVYFNKSLNAELTLTRVRATKIDYFGVL